MMISREAESQGLDAMQENGIDLTIPRQVTFFLYFPSLEAAHAAAAVLQADGFQNVRVGPAPRPSFWKRLFTPPRFSCLAEQTLVLEKEVVHAVSDKMNKLATKYSGDYDGWDAPTE